MPAQTRSKTQRTTRSSINQTSEVTAVPKVNSGPSDATPIDKNKPSGSGGTKKVSPPSKRARHISPEADTEVATAPKRESGKRGKLKAFMNLPIEIFPEIAIYLFPLDLIVLARTNKFFRQLLMRRSAIQIWRSAERNVVDLPPCPKDLCEPQYAALVFTKNCSICGKTAVRPMIPVLQVRLCVKCRDNEAVSTEYVSEPSLVFSSRSLMPGKRSWRSWCLFKDARAVKDKLNALALAGDKEETIRWRNKRLSIVSARVKESRRLTEYLKNAEEEHSAELTALKKAREEEIESRLLELGWVKEDFRCYDGWRMKQWSSLVHTPKPLTNLIWGNLLPVLVPFLELNRKERLEREAYHRKRERGSKIRDWIYTVTSQLEPFARVMGFVVPQAIDSAGPGSIDGREHVVVAAHPQNTTQLHDSWILKQSRPYTHTMEAWSEFKSMEEKDVSMDVFNVELEEMRPKLEELIQDWRSNFEQDLVNLLPGNNDSQAEDTQAFIVEDPLALGRSLPKLTLSLGTGSPTRPLNSLSTDMQRLLRADSVFTSGSSLYFYPDDFSSRWFTGSYGTDSVGIAQALLTTLGRPDATYLELKAAGKVFLCGRCEMNGRCKTWKEMIQHYIAEESAWDSAQRSARVRSADNFTYLFTHDIKTPKQDRPLIKVATKEEQAQPVVGYDYSPLYACRTCKSVDLCYIGQKDHIVDHLQYAHLVSEPEQGLHYGPP